MTKKEVLEKIEKTKTCWNWKGYIDNNGYGRVYYKKIPKTSGAHRIVYEILVGKIPKGLHLDHLCRNHKCVNPKHLEPVTPQINVLRGVGIAAVNAKKTHCTKGHLFSKTNTKVLRGWRVCVICRRDYMRVFMRKVRKPLSL